MSIDKRTIDEVSVWISRSFIAILVFLSTNIYIDVKGLSKDVPVLQEKIRSLEEGQSRLNNKIYPAITNTRTRLQEIQFLNTIK